MLALTLNPGSFIAVGENIKIYSREDHPVQIAIDAPLHIPILREGAKKKEA